MGQPRPKSEPQRLKPAGLGVLDRHEWKSCPSQPDGLRDVAPGAEARFHNGPLRGAEAPLFHGATGGCGTTEVVPLPYGACGIAKAMP